MVASGVTSHSASTSSSKSSNSFSDETNPKPPALSMGVFIPLVGHSVGCKMTDREIYRNTPMKFLRLSKPCSSLLFLRC
jgi:hypothetical protein